MSFDSRCFHDRTEPAPSTTLAERDRVRGVVVCLHRIGLGVYLPDADAFGHVNTPSMGVESVMSIDDYPLVGEWLPMVVVTSDPGRQLRLVVER